MLIYKLNKRAKNPFFSSLGWVFISLGEWDDVVELELIVDSLWVDSGCSEVLTVVLGDWEFDALPFDELLLSDWDVERESDVLALSLLVDDALSEITFSLFSLDDGEDTVSIDC